nr:hypothetical protein Q903MT_gene2889 [Picea sitchensis]
MVGSFRPLLKRLVGYAGPYPLACLGVRVGLPPSLLHLRSVPLALVVPCWE